MADIFDFPRDARNVARADGKGADMGGEAPQTMLMRPQGVPDQVWNAVLSVDCMRRLKGMTYREIPVPNSMANFGIGVALECDETYASGWIMINPNDSEHVSGTVTVTQNTAFGHDPDVPRVGCEIRVSWTPLDYADGGLDAGSQVGQWASFLRSMTQSEEENPVD